MYVYKVLSTQDWQDSQELGFIKRQSQDQNFIHMCAEEQIDLIVQKFWQGREQVLVAKLDPTQFIGDLKKETNPGGTNEYYHLYDGKIPLAAVVEILEYKSENINTPQFSIS